MSSGAGSGSGASSGASAGAAGSAGAGAAASTGGDGGATQSQGGATQAAQSSESIASVTSTDASKEAVVDTSKKSEKTEETTDQPTKKNLKEFSKEALKRFYESEDFGDDDDSISQGLEKLFTEHTDVKTKYSKHLEGSKKLSEIISSDPLFASTLKSMLADGDTLPVALAKHYDLSQLSLKEGDEGWEAFTEAEKSRKEKHKKDTETQETIYKNRDKAVKVFNEFVDKTYGEDKDGKEQFVSWLDNTIVSILKSDFNKDVLEKLHQGFKYEVAVEEARQDGEIAGKNKTIDAKMKSDEDKAVGDGLPKIGGAENKETETDPFLTFKTAKKGLRL